jgi:hypothetical protein
MDEVVVKTGQLEQLSSVEAQMTARKMTSYGMTDCHN